MPNKETSASPDETESDDSLTVAEKVDAWLAKVCDEDVIAGTQSDYFPTEAELEYYVDSIADRTEADVADLLERLLMPSAAFGLDEIYYAGTQKFPELDKGITNPETGIRNQFLRRRKAYFDGETTIPPWEGNSWVIDLLPDYPGRALRVIDDYFRAHLWFLSDAKIWSMSDAQTLIRAKFIGVPETQKEKLEFLGNIEPRQFECLAERLYAAMGYKTELTKPSSDGGRDVIATRSEPGTKDHVQVECKRYNKKVGVPIVRQLLGVVADQKSSRGVQIGLSGFTKPAIDFAVNNPRIELLSGEQLVARLNEFLGTRWTKMLDRLVTESESGKAFH